MTESTRSSPLWTVPNLICYLRILGLVPFLWAAWHDRRQLAAWILVVLLFSDWLDGKLARWLDQRTDFGARLDSAADSVLYLAVGVGFLWLEGAAILSMWRWILAVTVSWLLSAAVSWRRFGRQPSYHTRAAKVCWLVFGVAALYWLATSDLAAMPWALGLVTLTNLEAVALGLLLPSWRADVPTAFHAWRLRRDSSDTVVDTVEEP